MNAPKHEPNLASVEEMLILLRILSGETPVIINPEKLMETGELFKDIDIYGVAACLNGLRKLIESGNAELEKRIEYLEKRERLYGHIDASDA